VGVVIGNSTKTGEDNVEEEMNEESISDVRNGRSGNNATTVKYLLIS